MKPITVAASFYIIIQLLHISFAALPTKFQWKYIDYSWQGDDKSTAVEQGYYIPESILPTGIARWKNKLFITVSRWKKGVPASLNYINVHGPENQTLTPYPSWSEGFVPDDACCIPSNKTVISAFKPTVDRCDRLWVVDNGVADMANSVRQMANPAIVVFDLKNNELLTRYIIPEDRLRESSVLSSVEVDCEGMCSCENSFAYITDMGANALIVYDLKNNASWRIEHKHFEFDPLAGLYSVGGIDFFWSDGISSVVLGPRDLETNYPDLYFHPTSSTKLYKISTRLLRPNVSADEIAIGVEVVGDRGPDSQATALAYDREENVFFYTLLSQNGVGCWHLCKTFEKENFPIIFQDNNELEFPNDVKTDEAGNIWILSDRQSRFLYNTMDFNDTNFRIITAPVKSIIANTPCDGCKRCSICTKRKSYSNKKKEFKGRSGIRSSDALEQVSNKGVLSKIFKRKRNKSE